MEKNSRPARGEGASGESGGGTSVGARSCCCDSTVAGRGLPCPLCVRSPAALTWQVQQPRLH